MAKTYEELLAGATQIKNNELPESNTHSLVGGQLVDMVEKQKEDSERIDNVSKSHKGYFQTLEQLKAKYPTPKEGETAWVGEPYPGNVYDVVDGAWHDTSVPANEGGGSGSSNYNDLDNKPSIGNVSLEGNKTLEELGIASKQEVEKKQDAISQVNVTVDDAEGTPSGSASVDGSTLNIDLKNLKGKPGEAGPVNTLTIGTVTASDSPDEAKAEITGEAPNQILNLTLPRGQQGNSGVTGDTSNIVVVNDLNGGESETGSIKVLAAEQGKVLSKKIEDARYFVETTTNEYNPSGASAMPAIGTTLKAGVTYTVQLDYNIVTGTFVFLGTSNINSGNPKDKLTGDLYNKKGSLTIEYTPSIDVLYWRIALSSDYVYSEDSYISIAYSEKTDSKEIIQSLQTEVLKLNDVVETLGTLTILDKDYVPTKEAYRPAIGTTLKAGIKYTVQLDYSIVTGNFAYLGASNSEGGMPADNLTGNLFNQKGSRTIEYTPSVDVTYWYIQMASNFVYSESSKVSISVVEKVEVAETVKNLQDNVDTLKSKVTSIIATDFDLTASASKVLTSNYARNETAVSLRIQANGLFGGIRIKYGSSMYVDILDNTVEISNGNSEEHNLNLASKNNIGIFLEKNNGRTILIRISADGLLYSTSEITFASQGGVTVQNLGSNTLNFTSFAYCPKMINYELWFIGDSYMSTGDPARWPQQLSSFGYSKYYIDQLSGGASPTMYNSLMADLKIKKPKYLVWGLGMNDTDGTTVSSSWLTAIQNVMKLADEGINVILCTIPSVPSRSNKLKNEFVKSSGFRYIDFAAAVEKGDGSQNWHDGLLNSDGVHPTEAGAKLLAAQVLIDFPELCTIAR